MRIKSPSCITKRANLSPFIMLFILPSCNDDSACGHTFSQLRKEYLLCNTALIGFDYLSLLLKLFTFSFIMAAESVFMEYSALISFILGQLI